jgi:hypothetical protein
MRIRDAPIVCGSLMALILTWNTWGSMWVRSARSDRRVELAFDV